MDTATQALVAEAMELSYAQCDAHWEALMRLRGSKLSPQEHAALEAACSLIIIKRSAIHAAKLRVLYPRKRR